SKVSLGAEAPWSTLHKLESCWRAWFPSRLDALSAVCCGLGFGSYGAFSDGCVSSFTLALAQSSEFEQEPLQTHTIVPLSWLPTTLTRPGSGHAILKNVHWGCANQQTGNSPRLLKRRRNGCTAGCAHGPSGSGCRRAQGI